jgi:orotidine-5'-phosphate decarboxylase
LPFDPFQNTLPRARLIFPLDLPTKSAALNYVELLKGSVGFFKVGLELFSSQGPSIIEEIRSLAPEVGIFLDLKLHDIPATISRAMEAIARLGVHMTTVHAQGGPEMLRAAVKAAGQTKVLAVTLLTSLAPAAMQELAPDYRAPGALALHLAKRAVATSCHGVVASPLETLLLREHLGDEPILVTPGIRPSWAQVSSDDQSRTGTPAQALADGASYLVVGRPIRDAKDPLKAAQRILAELASS